MLKRAHWLEMIGFASLASVALFASGCQPSCQTASDCGSGAFCEIADTACLTARAVGFCKPIPTACPAVYSPVCGCNGNTYANGCEAARAGAATATSAACVATCGGAAGIQCAADQYCAFATTGSCLTANAEGSCQSKPTACSTVVSPVCGCDGRTYSNGCVAAQAGASVAQTSACDGG